MISHFLYNFLQPSELITFLRISSSGAVGCKVAAHFTVVHFKVDLIVDIAVVISVKFIATDGIKAHLCDFIERIAQHHFLPDNSCTSVDLLAGSTAAILITLQGITGKVFTDNDQILYVFIFLPQTLTDEEIPVFLPGIDTGSASVKAVGQDLRLFRISHKAHAEAGGFYLVTAGDIRQLIYNDRRRQCGRILKGSIQITAVSQECFVSFPGGNTVQIQTGAVLVTRAPEIAGISACVKLPVDGFPIYCNFWPFHRLKISRDGIDSRALQLLIRVVGQRVGIGKDNAIIIAAPLLNIPAVAAVDRKIIGELSLCVKV